MRPLSPELLLSPISTGLHHGLLFCEFANRVGKREHWEGARHQNLICESLNLGMKKTCLRQVFCVYQGASPPLRVNTSLHYDNYYFYPLVSFTCTSLLAWDSGLKAVGTLSGASEPDDNTICASLRWHFELSCGAATKFLVASICSIT